MHVYVLVGIYIRCCRFYLFFYQYVWYCFFVVTYYTVRLFPLMLFLLERNSSLHSHICVCKFPVRSNFNNNIHSTLENVKFADNDPFGSPALHRSSLSDAVIKDNKLCICYAMCVCASTCAKCIFLLLPICLCMCADYYWWFSAFNVFASMQNLCFRTWHACKQLQPHACRRSQWFGCNDHWPSDRIWLTKPIRADKCLFYSHTIYVAHANSLAFVLGIRNSI